MDDFVLVKKTHRQTYPKMSGYMKMQDYLDLMKEKNGLEYCPSGEFKIDLLYNLFRVINKNKAMMFCIQNGDVISKPQKS